MEDHRSAGAQPGPHGESRSTAQGGVANEEEGNLESSLPTQWPLFESPTVTTIRVTSYIDRQGTFVSPLHKPLPGLFQVFLVPKYPIDPYMYIAYIYIEVS